MVGTDSICVLLPTTGSDAAGAKEITVPDTVIAGHRGPESDYQ